MSGLGPRCWCCGGWEGLQLVEPLRAGGRWRLLGGGREQWECVDAGLCLARRQAT